MQPAPLTSGVRGQRHVHYDRVGNLVLWLSTIGLVLGFLGSVGLALLTKVLVTINPDGSQSIGSTTLPPELARKRNIRLRHMQRIGIPVSYIGIALGFLSQLVALWLPSSIH